ncbi:YncE family protein [Sphingomicrobium marinum]|uniref:YncE family protein n=1 Tax=Sphingomicrobium marinum TaxID=1227950 RepID=UPI00224074A0|nr:YncE family protein [Sphingomicrobium marinum]
MRRFFPLSVLCLLAAPAAADTLIVGNKAEHTVSFVDLETGEEVRRVETGRAPHEIAVSPDGTTAVVVSYAEAGYIGNTLHLFDVATGKKTGVIDLGEHQAPHGLKWIGGDDLVIVTTERSQDVAIVDVENGTVTASLKTGMQGSHMVALSPDVRRAYVANIGSGNMSVFDLPTGEKVADVTVGAQAEAVTVSPDGREVWVGSNGERKVVRFDAASLEQLGTFDVAGVPIRVEFSPSGQHVAISHFDRAEVIIVDASSQELVATVDLGEADLAVPVTMLWSHDGSKLWVAATGSQAVAEIHASHWTINRIFAVGAGSDGLGYSPLDTAAD